MSPLLKGTVGGRLKQFASFWRSLGVDRWVEDLVTIGHSLEFTEKPPLGLRIRWTLLRDPRQASILAAEISELLQKDAIEVADPKSMGFYSTFFVVPKKDGGLRPILNLKPLNRYVVYKKFTMETAKSVLQYLSEGDWVTSMDLKDAYLHVPILPAHRPYLRFAFQAKTYQFKVLPFGLASAPRVFTMVLAPLVKALHTQGILFVPYLDDCLIIAKSREALVAQVQVAVDCLQKAGFLINPEKSFLVPTQDLVFLGARIRTDLGSVHLPVEKAQRVSRFAKTFLPLSVHPAQECLRLLGLMASCLLVVPLARLRMRPFQLFFLAQWNSTRFRLDHPITIPQSVVPFLQIWSDIDWLTRGVPFQDPTPSLQITTDASNAGWGGHFEAYQTQGKWKENQLSLHINCQEMLAVLYTLRKFVSFLKGHRVLVLTDSMAVKQYINKLGGTKSASLCALTLRLIQWCAENNISLMAQHVPGIQNTLADQLSRQFCPLIEWSLKQRVVDSLFVLWGEPSMDLFASAENKRCPVYCAWHGDLNAFHLDALSLDWRGLFAYAFPPFPILPRVIRKVQRDQAELILVAPWWPTRAWFVPLLHLLIENPICLPLLPDLLTQRKGNLWHPNPGDWCLAAWRLSADPYKLRVYHEQLLRPSLHLGLTQPTRSTSQRGSCIRLGPGRSAWIPLEPMSPRS